MGCEISAFVKKNRSRIDSFPIFKNLVSKCQILDLWLFCLADYKKILLFLQLRCKFFFTLVFNRLSTLCQHSFKCEDISFFVYVQTLMFMYDALDLCMSLLFCVRGPSIYDATIFQGNGRSKEKWSCKSEKSNVMGISLDQFCLTIFQIEGWLELGTPSVDTLHRSDCIWLCCLSCQ